MKEDSERNKGKWFRVMQKSILGGALGYLGGPVAVLRIMNNQSSLSPDDFIHYQVLANIQTQISKLLIEKEILNVRAEKLGMALQEKYDWISEDINNIAIYQDDSINDI